MGLWWFRLEHGLEELILKGRPNPAETSSASDSIFLTDHSAPLITEDRTIPSWLYLVLFFSLLTHTTNSD
jgi:hypothetical protein